MIATLALIATLGPTVAMAIEPSAPPPGAHAPIRFAGQTTDGKTVSFPPDGAGKPVVFVVGFTQKSAGALDCWGAGLERRVGSRADGVAVAVLDAVPGFIRGFVRHAIDKQVGPPAPDRPVFVTTFDGGSLRANAPAGNADTPVIYIVGPDGSLASAERTACSADALGSVERAVP